MRDWSSEAHYALPPKRALKEAGLLKVLEGLGHISEAEAGQGG